MLSGSCLLWHTDSANQALDYLDFGPTCANVFSGNQRGAMNENEDKDQVFSLVIAEVDQRFQSGEVDRTFGACARPMQDTVDKLHKAEELDPQTLRLTVTI